MTWQSAESESAHRGQSTESKERRKHGECRQRTPEVWGHRPGALRRQGMQGEMPGFQKETRECHIFGVRTLLSCYPLTVRWSLVIWTEPASPRASEFVRASGGPAAQQHGSGSVAATNVRGYGG